MFNVFLLFCCYLEPSDEDGGDEHAGDDDADVYHGVGPGPEVRRLFKEMTIYMYCFYRYKIA